MTGSAAAFAEHLSRHLGGAASIPPALAARTGTPADGRFAAVFAPPDAAAVAAVLATCAAEGWPVQPAGAATWLGQAARLDPAAARPGQPAGRPPVLISTVRLNAITEHEPADLVIGVQAGLTLDRLNNVLSATDQWLPLDPAAAPDATIGAVIARADAGPLRARHGTPRDMTLGIQVATGDGRLVRFGGRVVKNVAGYDGVRLLTGSAGSLGIITAVYLRVRGAPRADHTLALAYGDGPPGAARAAEAALAIREAVSCDALELVSPAVARAIGAPEGTGWALLARFLGSDAAVKEAVDRVRRLAVNRAGTGGHGPLAVLPASVWPILRRLEANADQAFRITGPTADLAAGARAAAESLNHQSATNMGRWHCAAHAADGIVRLWRPGNAESPIGSGTPVAVDDLDRFASTAASAGWTFRYGGGPTVASPPGSPAMAAVLVPRPQPLSDGVRELTRRIRSAFDPAGILPGSEEES